MKKRRLLTGLLFTLIVPFCWADSLSDQRVRYQQVKQAWDEKRMNDVARLMPTLKNYPLYPYLEYRQLTQNLKTLPIAQAKQFVTRYPTLPLSRSLSNNFINELANRQDWRGIMTFAAQEPTSIASRCHYYYAQWATGEKETAYQQAKTVWLTGQTLPPACDKLFNEWRKSGEQSPLAILERIRLAGEAENNTLVAALVNQLPADYKTIAEGISALQKNPMSVETYAANFTPTDFTREETRLAFVNVARRDSEKARAMLPKLVRLQKMSKAEQQEMEEIVAGRYLNRTATAEQAKWRDAVLARSDNSGLLERRIRLSLSDNDKAGVARWIERLPPETAQKEEWRYWKADGLIAQGKTKLGESILRELVPHRGFYPMVAAQRLGIPYTVNVASAQKPTNALISTPEVRRVRELMYWRQDNLARSEWRNFILSLPEHDRQSMARYAYEQKWADLSVQATIVAKLWNHLRERFPLAYPALYKAATQDKAITVSFAMAITRQESAWNPQAQSPVGARGLMQLMPATAKQTAQQSKMTGYRNVSQLFDPQTNIQLGTRYLEYTYQLFGRNRILAAAAYNAGPGRVNTWLNQSAGRLDAVAFVESIPFSETRGYVKNVLAYDLFYRHFMNQPTVIMTNEEWKRRY